MSTKLLVTLQEPGDAATVRDSDVEVLAEYPDSMLVRGTEEQARQLTDRGIETTPIPEQATQVSGSTFDFDDAVRAQDLAPLDQSPGRTAYYLVKLAGPPAAGWLPAVEGLGATILDSLPGFTVLVAVLPERLDAIRAQPWVDDVTPYRPAMKVSPKLRPGVGRDLDAGSLATLGADEFTDEDMPLVEVTVFPGESVNDLAALVRAAGGTVLSTLPRSLVASVRPSTIADLAEVQGVQAILPHALPEAHNDKAAVVMRLPVDHTFDGVSLTGKDQIVGIADSGLDNGDPATLHPDIRGRVVGMVSFGVSTDLAPYTNDPAGNDDGPADQDSGHGTHVTGSVLGNGAAAGAAGSDLVPAGAAPEASVYFQAIGQKVNWKTVEQLAADGLQPFRPTWPPPASSLYGIPDDIATLFRQAYAAGARIHTNSWGAPTAGTYNANARAVDQFMWNNPDMLILYSAGNDGSDKDDDGVVDMDSIGAPGTAKNCLTVGASENNRPRGSTPPPGIDRDWKEFRAFPRLIAAGHVSDNVDGMAAFSSRGPTDDRRIKPDVVAPGTNVLSTLSSVFPAEKVPLWGRLPEGHPLRSRYCWSGGTSMSTPLVAGVAALVREHLVTQRGHLQANRKPSGALIKAILVNGAVPMVGQFAGEIAAGPNMASGFGRVDVMGSMAAEFVDEPDHAVSTGEMRTYEVSAVDPGTPLKITLVWTDAPSLEGVGELVNQLYLQVRTPDGAVLDGDITPFPTATNNVQQVRITAPTAGVYTVRVRGVAVLRHAPGATPGAVPRQDFAVALSSVRTVVLRSR
ncbi:MAG TPA: S8 family serine peptidase [Asanoa sp.]